MPPHASFVLSFRFYPISRWNLTGCLSPPFAITKSTEGYLLSSIALSNLFSAIKAEELAKVNKKIRSSAQGDRFLETTLEEET